MLLEQTHEKLIAMKLYGMANALKTRLERADHQSLTKEEFVSTTSGSTVRTESSPHGSRSLGSKSVPPPSRTSTTERLVDCARPKCSSSRRTAGFVQTNA